MRLPLKVFILAFFSILLSVIPHTALAQNVTSLAVSVPSSVEMDDYFTVTAYYTANGTNICGATCRVEGGWLSSAVYLSEGSGCIYENTIYAYSTPGAYSLSVYCYKEYYESQTEYFNIDITEKSSSLSVSVSPSSPHPGDMVTIYAYYRDGDGYLIQDGSCTADLKKSGVYFGSVNLVRYGNDYYSGTFFVPYEYGTYKVEVTCTSGEYETDYSEKSFTTSKKKALLTLSMPSSGYYGELVRGTAYYNDEKGEKIEGLCRAYFDDKVSTLSSRELGYDVGVSIPYKAGPHSLRVTCESAAYETLETSLDISAINRPARTEVISPPKGAVFYPTDEIQLRISYEDTISKSNILGARCSAQFGGESYPMAESGNYYLANISNQPIGQQNIQFTCSKTFYEGTENSIQVSIVRIPIDIILTSQKTDFHGEEEIKILARVVDKRHNDVNADCRARADVYDLSFNRLVKSFDILDMEVSEGFRVLDIPNPGEPSRIRVTVTCFGDILEEKSVYTEVKIKMLGRQTEEGMILFLTVTTITLLALTFLIRKKLKII